ncbi:MAG: zinc ribbon domain-containing protein [Acidobacteria bacterium]|nr:zinc ribbon domain-containing protein [Acidobacteriota bacterium]MCK6683281.1 zinc ribbon domain-containing protein [Thermoanaerobaculia bacterium]
MPIYEFICDVCGTPFEAIVASSGSPAPECPECASEKVSKQLSRFSGKSGGASSSGPKGSSSCGPRGFS